MQSFNQPNFEILTAMHGNLPKGRGCLERRPGRPDPEKNGC